MVRIETALNANIRFCGIKELWEFLALVPPRPVFGIGTSPVIV